MRLMVVFKSAFLYQNRTHLLCVSFMIITVLYLNASKMFEIEIERANVAFHKNTRQRKKNFVMNSRTFGVRARCDPDEIRFRYERCTYYISYVCAPWGFCAHIQPTKLLCSLLRCRALVLRAQHSDVFVYIRIQAFALSYVD